MSPGSLFKTATRVDAPFDGSMAFAPGSSSGGPASTASASVSDFLTVQALTNFAAMTGAITAAWHALARLSPVFSSPWVPYAFAGAFGLVSILMSSDALKNQGSLKLDFGRVMAAIFIAVINALVLASAVVGTGTVLPGPTP